jgi:hypothetical protein
VPQAFQSKGFVRVGPVREPSAPAILDLQVVFTNTAGTRAALATAGQYARGLDVRITILAAQVVPYPLPLGRPPVPVEFTERTLRSLASEQIVTTSVELYLCRDKNETIRKVLKPDSLVVIGGWKRWWPAAENRLEKLLRRDGHRVILANDIFA